MADKMMHVHQRNLGSVQRASYSMCQIITRTRVRAADFKINSRSVVSFDFSWRLVPDSLVNVSLVRLSTPIASLLGPVLCGVLPLDSGKAHTSRNRGAKWTSVVVVPYAISIMTLWGVEA